MPKKKKPKVYNLDKSDVIEGEIVEPTSAKTFKTSKLHRTYGEYREYLRNKILEEENKVDIRDIYSEEEIAQFEKTTEKFKKLFDEIQPAFELVEIFRTHDFSKTLVPLQQTHFALQVIQVETSHFASTLRGLQDYFTQISEQIRSMHQTFSAVFEAATYVSRIFEQNARAAESLRTAIGIVDSPTILSSSFVFPKSPWAEILDFDISELAPDVSQTGLVGELVEKDMVIFVDGETTYLSVAGSSSSIEKILSVLNRLDSKPKQLPPAEVLQLPERIESKIVTENRRYPLSLDLDGQDIVITGSFLDGKSFKLFKSNKSLLSRIIRTLLELHRPYRAQYSVEYKGTEVKNVHGTFTENQSDKIEEINTIDKQLTRGLTVLGEILIKRMLDVKTYGGKQFFIFRSAIDETDFFTINEETKKQIEQECLALLNTVKN